LAVLLPIVAVVVILGALFLRDKLTLADSEPMEMSFTVYGEQVPRSLSQFQGRVVALQLWKPSCEACMEQFYILTELQKEAGSEGLISVAVSDDPEEGLAQAVRDSGSPVLTGQVSKSELELLPKQRPCLILLDREGRVARRYENGVSLGKLRDHVDPLLGR